MSIVEFKDKFVAFVDVLGFKRLVEAAEAGSGTALEEVLGVLKDFGSPEKRIGFDKYGPTLCPQSPCVRRDLDFRVTHISDCLVVSCEISPAGVINLINHCSSVVFCLLHRGFMSRGYMTRGSIFHTDTDLVGTAYQRAYENESKVAAFKREADERGTPFVEIDRAVCDYIAQCEDKCVKEMFSRSVKDDGETVALFPFQSLAHSFMIGGRAPRFAACGRTGG